VVIVSVESTRSAVASLKAESFDVVISDIQRDREAVDAIKGAAPTRAASLAVPAMR
jgi:hypothetical protein